MALIAEETVAGQTFRHTKDVDARSGSFSPSTFPLLAPLAATPLASGYRSAPRLPSLDADRCSLVNREHK